jgi:hypothetical protein
MISRPTWPTNGHGEDDDEEEESNDGEADGQVTASVVEAELLSVPLQEAFFLLPGGSNLHFPGLGAYISLLFPISIFQICSYNYKHIISGINLHW